ncbi:hypothetical protein HKX48_004152 [Thoreauomyces humboldtii]|nr:hypothetical protein HKX48_004152 [Thoreauomyces humboldtii]
MARLPVHKFSTAGKDGNQEYGTYELATEQVAARFTTLGAHLTHVFVKDRTGIERDVVLGFDTPDEYAKAGEGSNPYFGATVGRTCNRITKGQFSLNGKQYQLPINNGPNNLHGGVNGFDKRVWTATVITENPPTLRFDYTAADGEEGYPGEVAVSCTYTLRGAALSINYEAHLTENNPKDLETIISMTNHTYWNLTGCADPTVKAHTFHTVPVAGVLAVTDDQAPTGQVLPTSDDPLHPFNFEQTPRVLGDGLVQGMSHVELFKGYDHYLLLGDGHSTNAPIATLSAPSSGISLTVATDASGLQLYTGNFLLGDFNGKKTQPEGTVYVQHAGVALETSAPLDAVNHPAWREKTPRAATAFGDFAVDLLTLAKSGVFDTDTESPLKEGVAEKIFSQPSLNDFMALGKPAWRAARRTLQKFLSGDRSAGAAPSGAFIPLSDVKNHMPAQIGDYTDFYASKEHATAVGVMFRGKENALMPNWVQLPVGYHGRASSVVVSGTSIRRPAGLILDPATKLPHYSPSKKLDYELEVAAFVGVGNNLGSPIDVDSAADHIFGLVLMNDWSARDIQAYEYVPLGPFLGKNFGTTISPWIVTLDALEEFRVAQPAQDPIPAHYLRSSPRDAFDIKLDVAIKPKSAVDASVVARSNLKYMYWSFNQMLAHHTVNGCNMRPGDLLGSGTISGPESSAEDGSSASGSLLELSHNGTAPFMLGDQQRTFIEDGDEVVISGYCCKGDKKDGSYVRVGFGQARGVLTSN